MPAFSFSLTGQERLEAGATWDRTFDLIYPNGDPVDLTLHDPITSPGANGGRMRLRITVDQTTTLLQLSPTVTAGAQGVQIVQPPTLGKIRVVIEPETLATISYTASTPNPANRSGVYDLETSTGTATPTTYTVRWLEGSFVITPEVTRAD